MRQPALADRDPLLFARVQDSDPRARRDEQRELTVRGADDIGFGCQQFHQACEARGIAQPAHILHSPWLRTTQTAEIIAGAYSHARLEPCEALRPGATPADVERTLGAFEADEHVLLVHHQPLVSRVLGHYLGDAAQVPFLDPGGLASLTMAFAAPGCASLLFWSVPPEYEVGL